MLSNNSKRSLISSFFIFSLSFCTTCFSQSTFSIKVSSSNLSEDVSSLTTQNDELLLYIFELIDDSIHIITHQYFSLDNQHLEASITATNNPISDSLYLFIIEIDSEEPLGRIIEKIVKSKEELIKHHFELNIKKIKQLLGDDDIISAKKIANMSQDFIESGFHLFDKYVYQIRITTF